MNNTRLPFVMNTSIGVALALLLSGCGSAPPPRPVPPPRWNPPSAPTGSPQPSRQTTQPVDTCELSFNPCSCDLKKYSISSLDEKLSSPGITQIQRGETAANLRNVANDFNNIFWKTGAKESAWRALRYYDGYLVLVPLSDRYAPYALLRSIKLYCGLGCHYKARDLAQELRSNYRFDPVQIDTALATCR